MFASPCSQIGIFKALQNSLKKELALSEPVRPRVTAAAASTDLSEMLLAGQITEMQWVAKLSFITVPADLGHGGSPCSLLCRQGSFSAVAALPAVTELMWQSRRAEPAARGDPHLSQQDAASQTHCAGCQQASTHTVSVLSAVTLSLCSNSVWCVGCVDKAVETWSL